MNRFRLSHRPAKTWVVLLVALLVALGAVAYWKLMQSPSPPSVEELVAVADKFLQQVREGELDTAWQSTTVEFKSAMGKEYFRGYAKKKPVLGKSMEFIAAQQVMVQEQPRTELQYREPESGDSVRVLMGHERGVWKVDRLLGLD